MVSDAIEQEIFIRADITHVWSLISKAGFWIGHELHFEANAKEGETIVIEVEGYGGISVRVDRLDPPRYAAYHCAAGSPDADPTNAISTLVEFRLAEHDDGVILRLKESGFARMRDATAQYEANVAGWATQLNRLVRAAEGAPQR